MIYDIQKAGMWKRISAFLFDFIILITLAAGIAVGVSAAVRYDTWLEVHEEIKIEYEEKYGTDIDLSQSEVDALKGEEKEAYENAYKGFSGDKRTEATRIMLTNLSLVIVSLSLLLAFVALEFIVPLFLHNGQTLGKKIFGIGVVQVNGVRLKTVSLFARSILGKFAVETMIPVYVLLSVLIGSPGPMGLIAVAAVFITQIAMMIATKHNYAIHDGLALTVVVDIASQMIFESEDELIELKKKIAAERAEREDY